MAIQFFQCLASRFYRFGVMLLIVFSAASNAEGVHYEFDSEDASTNSRNCLTDWSPYGAGAAWRCVDGVLESYSLANGLRNNRIHMQNGSVGFKISNVIEAAPNGKGEFALWLRNGVGSDGRMQRVRIVFEQQATGGVVVRIEQFFQRYARYDVLRAFRIPEFVGTFVVSLEGNQVLVRTVFGTWSAATQVMGSGGIYLFSSGNEGGYSDIDFVSIQKNS